MKADAAEAEAHDRPQTPASRPALRWNLLANFAGYGWRAVMALVFVPFYVRILGLEAYGLIGLYAGLQVALGLFDAGLRPTLAREMARFTGGAIDAAAIRTLLRSIEVLLLTIAVLIFGGLALAAPWLSTHWVRAEHIAPSVVAQAFAVMGLVAGLQLLESAYSSALSGLQRQVLQNAIMSFMATLRGFGALAVLWNWPTLSAYFTWQAAVALLSLATCRLALGRSLPRASQVRFSLSALAGIRTYAAGVLAQAAVGLLLFQSDRLVLARLVSLRELGEYVIAAAVAGAAAFLSGPVGSAYQPRLTEIAIRGDLAGLSHTFHQATKILVLLVAAFAAMCMLFGDRLLQLWLGDPALASRTAPYLALLALGHLFGTVTGLSNLLHLAHGRTRALLFVYGAMLALFVPSLFVMVERYGAIGAAASWALINLAGMAASVQLSLRRYLPGETARFWFGDVVPTMAAVFAAAALLRAVLPHLANPLAEAAMLTAAGVAILTAGGLANRELRTAALRRVRGLRVQPADRS